MVEGGESLGHHDFLEPRIPKLQELAGEMVGPLTKELVVACKVYELQKDEKDIPYERIVEGLEGIINSTETFDVLQYLSYNWTLIQNISYPEHSYRVNPHHTEQIKQAYKESWQDVLEVARIA